jgi:hypothetical protein
MNRRGHIRKVTILKTLEIVYVPLVLRTVHVPAVIHVNRRCRSPSCEAALREELLEEGPECGEAGAYNTDTRSSVSKQDSR